MENSQNSASNSSRDEGFDIGTKLVQLGQEKNLILLTTFITILVGTFLYYQFKGSNQKYQLVLSVGKILINSNDESDVENRYKDGRIVSMLLKNQFRKDSSRKNTYLQHVDHLPASFDTLKAIIVGDTTDNVFQFKEKIFQFLEADFERSRSKPLQYKKTQIEVAQNQIKFLQGFLEKLNSTRPNKGISYQDYLFSEKLLNANLELIQLESDNGIETIPYQEILFGPVGSQVSNILLFLVISCSIFGLFIGLLLAQFKIWRRRRN